MPIAGDLTQVPLPQVLEMLQQQGRAGLLTIGAGAKETTLYFDGAAVRVFSVNGQKAMRIGDVLLEHERITEFQLKHALERQAETKQRLGEILVDLGLVAPEEIEQAIGTQAEEEIFEIFSLRDGQFRFAERELAESEYRPDPSAPDHPFPVEQLVTDVAQRVAEWQSLASDFRGDGDIFVVPPEDRSATLEALPDGAPKRMAELLDGTNTIGDLVHRLLLPRYKIYRTLAELVRDGHARQSSPDELRGTARKLRDDKQVKQAVKLLEHAFSIAPDNAEVVQELAEIHEAVGDKKRAGSFYKALADIHFNSGAADQGALVCAKVLEFLPSDPYPHERLVEHYIARDQRSRALDSARTLLRLYQHDGEIDRATELCGSFLEMFPEDIGLHERMVNLHLAAGRQEEAVGEYETMAELIGDDAARDPQQRDKERLEIFQKILLIDKERDDIRKVVEQLSGTADEVVVARKAVRRRSLLVVGVIVALLAAGAGFYEFQARGEYADLATRVDELANDGGRPLLSRIRVREELAKDLRSLVKRFGFATIAGNAETAAQKIVLQLDDLNEQNKRLIGQLKARYGEALEAHQGGEWDASDAICDEIIERDHQGTWRAKAHGLKARNGEQRRENFEQDVLKAIDALEERTAAAKANLKRAGSSGDEASVAARRVVTKELEEILDAFSAALARFADGGHEFPQLKSRAEKLRDAAGDVFQGAVILDAQQYILAGEILQAGDKNRWEDAEKQFNLAWIVLGSKYMEGNDQAAKLHGRAQAKRDAINDYFSQARRLDADREAAVREGRWGDALAHALRLNEKFRSWPKSRDHQVPLHIYIDTLPTGAAVWRQGGEQPEGTTPCAVAYPYHRRTVFQVRLPGWEAREVDAGGASATASLSLVKTWLTRYEASGFSQGNRPAGRGAVTSTPLLVGEQLIVGGRVRRLQWIDLGADKTVAEYDLQLLGELRASPQAQGKWIYCVSTNNDLVHRVVAAGDPKGPGAWVSGQRLPSAPVGPPLLGGPGEPLAVLCDDGELVVVDPGSGAIITTYAQPGQPFGEPVRNAAGVWWVAENGTLRCTEPVTGDELASLKLPVRPTGNLVAADDRLVVPVGDAVWVFDGTPAGLGRAPIECAGVDDEIRSCTLDGARVWFGTASGQVGVWDLPAGGKPAMKPRQLYGRRPSPEKPPAVATNPAPPLRVDDALVVGTASGDILCLDAATLDVRWHVPVRGRVLARAVAWRDRVLVPCDDGHVYVFVR